MKPYPSPWGLTVEITEGHSNMWRLAEFPQNVVLRDNIILLENSPELIILIIGNKAFKYKIILIRNTNISFDYDLIEDKGI